jgi:Tfp pilus assembly protein PilX
VRGQQRGGAALLLCLTVIFLTTLLTVHVLDTTVVELSATRNSIEYDRALFLANAAVHAAASQLEADATWRGVVSEGTFPADDSYTATAVDGALPQTVTVTAQGAAGEVVRTVVAILQY